jgi:hypothetical protein
MKSLKEIRQKYPQYNDMSDEQLSSVLHQKHYKDIPIEEFNKRIGLNANKTIPQYMGDFGKAIQGTSTVKAGTSFVDALGNLGITIGNTLISPFTEQRVQTQNTIPGEDFSKSLGRSAGTALGLTGLGAGIGAGTTKGLQAAGTAIPATQKATGYLTSGRAVPATVGRFGEAGVSGALLSPEETMRAAEEALLFQAIAESIPYIGKAAKGSLDYIPGTEYMKEMTARLKSQMDIPEVEASKYFEMAQEGAGTKKLPLYNEEKAIRDTQKYNDEVVAAQKKYDDQVKSATKHNEEVVKASEGSASAQRKAQEEYIKELDFYKKELTKHEQDLAGKYLRTSAKPSAPSVPIATYNPAEFGAVIDVSKIPLPDIEAIAKPNIPEKTRFQQIMAGEDAPKLDTKLKATQDKYLKDSSYENAFKLQSDLAKREREIKPITDADISAKNKLTAAREALLEDINISMLGEDSEAARYLEKAMYQYATGVSPTKSNAKFMQIQEGLIGPSGPHVREGMLGIPSIKEMQELLKKELSATKKGGGFKFPETHPFHKELADLNKRAGRSTMAAAVNPVAWAMLIGKHYGLNTFDLLQNPEILNALATAGEATRFAGPKAAAGIAGGQ